jgi:hypothetical protein
MSDTGAKIRAYGVPQALLREFEDGIYAGLIGEWGAETRRIGHLLLEFGLDDIWRRVYRLHEPDAQAGDEHAFLRDRAGNPDP